MVWWMRCWIVSVEERGVIDEDLLIGRRLRQVLCDEWKMKGGWL